MTHYASGTRLLVKYNVAERVHHARFVLAHVFGQHYVILTPDGDIYDDDYLDRVNITGHRVWPPDGSLPYGLMPQMVHDFTVWPTDDEAAALFVEGEVEAARIRTDEGLQVDGSVAVDMRVAPAVGGTGDGAVVDAGDGGGAAAVAPRGRGAGRLGADAMVAAAVGPDPGAGGAVVERRRIGPVVGVDRGGGGPDAGVGGGLDALRAALSANSPKADAGAAASSTCEKGSDDLRTLPVQYEATGGRFRAFRECINCFDETPFPDWPVPGPLTVQWCCKFMRDKGGSPTAWHNMWKLTGKLQDHENNVIAHEGLCRTLEVMCVYDQLDAVNIAAAELVCRQIQTLEENLKSRFISDQDTGMDLYLMSGAPSRAQLCICPALSQWVATEASKESAVLKERRKAREERALLKPGKDKNKDKDK